MILIMNSRVSPDEQFSYQSAPSRGRSVIRSGVVPAQAETASCVHLAGAARVNAVRAPGKASLRERALT